MNKLSSAFRRVVQILITDSNPSFIFNFEIGSNLDHLFKFGPEFLFNISYSYI